MPRTNLQIVEKECVADFEFDAVDDCGNRSSVMQSVRIDQTAQPSWFQDILEIMSRRRQEGVPGKTVAQPQAHHQYFLNPIRRRHGIGFSRPVTLGRNRLEPVAGSGYLLGGKHAVFQG